MLVAEASTAWRSSGSPEWNVRERLGRRMWVMLVGQEVGGTCWSFDQSLLVVRRVSAPDAAICSRSVVRVDGV